MGVARVRCRSGCTCKDSTLDGTWAKQVSLQQIHMFQVGGGEEGRGACAWSGPQPARPAAALPCAACALSVPLALPAPPPSLPLQVSQHERCVIRVTVVNETGEAKSDGHKVGVVVVVGGIPRLAQPASLAAA